MKKIFTLITMAMMFVAVSQAEVTKRPAVKKAARKVIYVGNDKYYPATETYYVADGSYKSKYEYTYDGNGNSVYMTLYVWTDGEWRVSVTYECPRDEHGNYLKWIDSYYEGGVLTHSNEYKCENTYDENGNLVQQMTHKLKDGEWVLDGKEEDAYDSKGNITEYWQYYYVDGVWTFSEHNKYTYDDNGNLLLYLCIDEGGTCYMKYVDTYDSDGKLIEEDIYYKNDVDLELISKSEYIYNEQGKLCRCIDANGKYEYAYDEKGNMVKSEYYSLEDGSYVFKNYTEYTYSEESSITDLTAISHAAPRKVLVDGRVCIQLPNGQLYDATGRKMK